MQSHQKIKFEKVPCTCIFLVKNFFYLKKIVILIEIKLFSKFTIVVVFKKTKMYCNIFINIFQHFNK